MKKVIIIIALLASMGGAATAQDTLWQRPYPLSNYFTNNWIDTTTAMYTAGEMGYGLAAGIARRFYTEDTLQVYGIAAMMFNEYFAIDPWVTPAQLQAELEHRFPEDPTFDNLKESLKLYQYQGGGDPVMQQLGDSLPIHYKVTPVSYYFLSHGPSVLYLDTFAKPVYERYFTEPQTVHDTFFAGFTINKWRYNKHTFLWYQRRPSFFCPAFDHTCEGLDLDSAYNKEAVAVNRMDLSHTWWWFKWGDIGGAYCIFPILTPPDTTYGGGTSVSGDTVFVYDTVIIGSDTTVTIDTVSYGDVTVGRDTVDMGGDTLVVSDTLVVNGDTIVVHDTLLTIVPGDLLQRLTGVQPNPAATVARVVSSAGITALDAYTLDGRRVHTQRLDGAPLTATIDVSRWPAGTYLLRIRTPMGTALKKLTVAR